MAGKKVGVTYDAADRLDQIKRYNNAAGSGTATVTSTYTFDEADRLTGLVHANSASTSINTYAWSWNASNRLTAASSKVNGSSTAEWAVAYGYDDRGQLTSADWTTVSGLSSLLVDETYNFTDNGNRSGSQTNGVGTKTYVNSTNNQTTADGRFTYTFDAEGNRGTKTDNVGGAFTLYAWDNRDRLVKVTEKTSSTGSTTKIFEEVYDAFDRWIGEKIDANGDGDYLDSGDHARAFLYDGMKIVNQFDKAGNASSLTQTHRYLQGPSRGLAAREAAFDMLFADEQLTGSAGTLWDLGDNLGSVRDVVNSSGAVVDHIVYDSYGRVVQSTSGAPDRLHGFTGQPFDIFDSLQNNWHRWYDAEIGKWVSEDPIGFGGLDNNLLRYAANEPLASVDPTGNVRYRRVGGDIYEDNWWGEEHFIGKFNPDDQSVTRNGKTIPLSELSNCVILSQNWDEDADKARDDAFRRRYKELHPGGNKQLGGGGFVGGTGGSGGSEKPGPQKPSKPEYPGNDPSKGPPGTQWNGKPGSTPGGGEGNYYNPTTGESFNPDLNHSLPIGPHWDYVCPRGVHYRLFPNGTMIAK